MGSCQKRQVRQPRSPLRSLEPVGSILDEGRHRGFKNECPCRCCSATQHPCGLEAALVFLAALTDGDLHCSFYFNSNDQRTLTHDLTWCEAFVAPFPVDPIAAMCLLSASACPFFLIMCAMFLWPWTFCEVKLWISNRARHPQHLGAYVKLFPTPRRFTTPRAAPMSVFDHDVECDSCLRPDFESQWPVLLL